MSPEQHTPEQLRLALDSTLSVGQPSSQPVAVETQDRVVDAWPSQEHQGVVALGGVPVPRPVYGRPDGRPLSEALQDWWRTAAMLNQQQPGDGEWVPTAAIRIRDDLLPREHLDWEAVERYAEAFDRLPPITVQKNTFLLVDGRHRLAAAPKAIRDHIRIRELDIADDEIADWALQANIAHGVPLSQAERLRAAKRLFRRHHPKHGGAQAWSVAKIVEWCGVSRSTIHNWLAREEQREREAAGAQVSQGVQVGQVDSAAAGFRLGRDGKRRRVPGGTVRAQRPVAPGRTFAARSAPATRVTPLESTVQLLARPPGEVAGDVPMEALDGQIALAQRALDWIDAYRRALLTRKADRISAVTPAAST